MIPEGIAIVGMAGRFPGAPDVDTFWNNIKAGVESISHFAPEDLDIRAPSAEQSEADASFVCAKGILDDVDMFDARYFGYLPREAELMDPQHRVFLELCAQAIEDAGYDPQRYAGSIGVYGGCYMDTYLMWNLCSDPRFLARFIESIQVGSLQTELGNDKDYLATRVAFKLGLRGPAMTLQTACSTSLVAVVTACQSLASYQCDMALAGGVTIVLPQRKGYYFKEGGMLSPDGHCRTFDENAAGTVFSNGAAVVLLKRVADALADGDTIHAVIRGYASNNDGGAKVSYTAPSVAGQAEVISLALATGDVDARTIGYVEAHGTATPMGDPIEIAGLSQAFRADTRDTGFCAVGSVKANLGHLDVASGAIGLIKTVLAVEEGVLPPSINFTRPNPRIDFAGSPFYVNTQLRDWPQQSGYPRRAGVSSFGVGGTNAHVVLEQAPAPLPVGRSRPDSLLTLSAPNATALARQAERLADFLERRPDVSLEDAAYTLQVGRIQFDHRRVVVARGVADAVVKLRQAASPGDSNHLRTATRKLVFMFPGQGAQYPGMARELYESEPVFRDVIDRCCGALEQTDAGGQSPRRLLLWDPEHPTVDAAQASADLAQTGLAQPALFAMEMALTRLLESWGVRPSALIGHSVGEFSAACVAGVFEPEDAMRLVAARGRLMQAQPTGKMLAVRAPVARVEALLTPGVVIAAINAPGLTVVSGAAESIDSMAGALEQQGIQASLLVTSHAYHSPMMAAVRGPLAAEVAAVARRPAGLPIVSTALARVAGDAELSDPEYWGRQLLAPVRFADSVALAAPDADHLLLEVGPGQTLSALARQSLARDAGQVVLPCLGPVQSPGSDLANLLAAVGRLWLAGATPDWQALQPGNRRRIALPTYPFERKRFWVEPASFAPASSDADVPLAATPATGRDHEPSTRTQDAAMQAGPACDGGPADGMEQVIHQQLLLISDQIRAMHEITSKSN